jgi:hypothetical protein
MPDPLTARPWRVALTSPDGEHHAWLDRDGLASQCPTPDPAEARFATAEEAGRAPVPAGWTARAVRPRY